jgi:hypothetical protein
MRYLFLLIFTTVLFAEEANFSFKELFNGKDLSGWVDVNTSKATWKVKDGLLICSGKPIGVMRSEKQYENFILQIEWRHMKEGGNSGVFIWSEGTGYNNKPLPKGVEVQMLELQWSKIHKRTEAYVSGELFGSMGLKTTPDNPRGTRSKSVEMRCKGVGEWNRYTVVAVDGTVKLAINGKFVNGLSRSEIKKGYLCLEAEGSEIHFRNIRIMELEPAVTTENQKAPLIKEQPSK